MKFKAVLLCLTLVAAACAEEYRIQLKAMPEKGKSFTVASRDRMETNIVFRDTSGKEIGKDDADSVQAEEYTQETLEAADARPVKFKREYGKAVVTSGGKSRDLAYSGKAITFSIGEKGGCTHDLKAEKIGDGEKRKLAEADTDGLVMVSKLLPPGPVKVGSKWAISGKQIAAVTRTLAVDPEKSKGTGVLSSVDTKGGSKVGTMSFVLEIVSKDSADGKAEGTFELTVEAPIDGSSTEAKITIKTAIKMLAEVKEDGKDIKATVTARGEYKAVIGQEK
jgi:hypothetical protein